MSILADPGKLDGAQVGAVILLVIIALCVGIAFGGRGKK